jgi:hypothetical protein
MTPSMGFMVTPVGVMVSPLRGVMVNPLRCGRWRRALGAGPGEVEGHEVRLRPPAKRRTRLLLERAGLTQSAPPTLDRRLRQPRVLCESRHGRPALPGLVGIVRERDQDQQRPAHMLNRHEGPLFRYYKNVARGYLL